MTGFRPGKNKKGEAEAGKMTHASDLDFEGVYRSNFRGIYSFIAYRVGDRAAAEDVTSQVFEKALAAWESYDPERSAVTTWLFIIARNAVSDHFRRLGRLENAELDERTAASPTGDPQAMLESGETQQQLALALRGLEDRERELVALKFGAAMNNREIAELVGITESNAGTILFRSLRKLKKQLEGEVEND